jgi:hypothetical protein
MMYDTIKIVRGQQHVSKLKRAYRGFFILSIQLLVFSKRQEVVLFSEEEHDHVVFATNNKRYKLSSLYSIYSIS